MTAPALHPTARMRPVLLERLKRQGWGHCWAALLLAGMVVYLRVDSSRVPSRAAVVGVLLVGCILASAAHEDRPVWDAALPVDPARYALARLVSGTAWSAFVLAVVAGLYAALFRDPGNPGWYPLAIVGWGLTAHLLASAAFLRARAPVAFVVYPAVCLLSGALLLVCLQQPEELGRMGVTAVLARTALLPGLAGAAAYVAARFPGRAPEQSPRTPWWNSAGVRESRPAPLPLRPAPLPSRPAPLRDRPTPPARRARPARPAATLAVFRQHFALLCRFAIVPALTLLVLAVILTLTALTAEEGEATTVLYFVESTGLRWWCVWIALSWTLLVWMREHGAQRRWNDALPVGTGKRRVLHAAAGAAWLLIFLAVVVAAPLGAAAAAGTLASPADVPASLWLGLPCRTLTLYLAATLVFFGTRLALQVSPSIAYVLVGLRVDRVVPLMIVLMAIGMVAVPYLVFTRGIGLLESQAHAVGGGSGSSAASALWLVPYAAATALAIALNDWLHRLDRLPTVPEVRGVLHGWAGTRPGPPLQGPAER